MLYQNKLIISFMISKLTRRIVQNKKLNVDEYYGDGRSTKSEEKISRSALQA